MPDFIDLNRIFAPISAERAVTADEVEAWGRRAFGTLTWPDLLERSRVVILAEANSGKTEELRHRVREGRAAGRAVFFGAIEEISRLGFEAMLGRAETERLDAWKAASQPGWFMLDSLDEAKLSRQSFARALKSLGDALGEAYDRARVVISCRATDWDGDRDLQRILDSLPPPHVVVVEADPDAALLAPFASKASAQQIAVGPTSSQGILIVTMLSLTREQREAFLVHAKLEGISDFEAALIRQGLRSLAERPGDLANLARYWRANRTFGRLTEMMEQGLQSRLAERHTREDAAFLSDAKAREGAERLAAAMVLARSLTVLAPTEGEPVEQGLDPALVLPDWTASERNALLRRGLFAPASFGRARFHHRSAMEFLSAFWFARRLRAGMPESRVRDVFTRRPYGVATVAPSLRPTAGWLSQWSPLLRAYLLANEPTCLLAHGDPAALSIETRAALLRRLGKLADAGAVSEMRVNRQELWMFADARLAPTILEVLSAAHSNDLRFDLIRLIEVGRIQGCEDRVRAIALAASAPVYDRIAAARAMAATDDLAGMRDLAAAMLAEPAKYGPRIAPPLASALFPRALDLAGLLKLMAETPSARELQVEGFGYELGSIFEVCHSATERKAFLAGVAALCETPPLADWHGVSLQHRELAKHLEPLLRSAIVKSDTDGLSPGLVNLLSVGERTQLDILRESTPTIPELVAERPQLNRALFWADVTSGLRRHANPDRPLTVWMMHWGERRFWTLTDADILWLEAAVRGQAGLDERRVALSALWSLLRDSRTDLDRIADLVASNPALATDLAEWRAPRKESPDEVSWRRRDEVHRAEAAKRQDKIIEDWKAFRDRLQAEPRSLADRARLAEWPGPSDLLSLTTWLSRATGLDDAKSPSEWTRLALAFGDEVANAYAAGMRLLWRLTRPERPQYHRGGRRTEKHTAVLSVGGLNLEAGDAGWPTLLDDQEAARAIAHICHADRELPEWLPQFVGRWPEVAAPMVMAELAKEWRRSDPSYNPFLYRCEAHTELALALRKGLLGLITGREVLAVGRVRSAQQILRRLSITPDERAAVSRLVRLRLDRRSRAGDWEWVLAYLGLLLELDLELGVTKLEDVLASQLSEERAVRAEAALGTLFDQRNGAVQGLELAPPETLARLLRLTYGHVRREDDQEHEGSYQPDRRDNAESARNRILTALIQTRGEAAYRCMASLAADPAFGASQHRFAQLTRRMAELDAESPPWRETDFVAFIDRMESPVRTGSELLDLACGVIDDLSASFERGDFSPRALFETAEAEFAVQEFLAYHFEQAAHARYSVAREKQVKADLRPDIALTAAVGGAEVALEVKHGEMNWSLADLRHSLATQLAQDYLDTDRRRHGLFIVTNHRGARFWRRPEDRVRMTFAEVIADLAQLATTTTLNGDAYISIAVRGLDASDPRATRRRGRRSPRRVSP